jgi:hypothetical protein
LAVGEVDLTHAALDAFEQTVAKFSTVCGHTAERG